MEEKLMKRLHEIAETRQEHRRTVADAIREARAHEAEILRLDGEQRAIETILRGMKEEEQGPLPPVE